MTTESHIHTDSQNWDIEISSSRGLFDINMAELWRYRDLLGMFVKKDIITVYKQTILGPIWFLLQPILTTLVYIIVFGRIAKIPTSGVPPVLFYLGSLTLWNYFSETLSVTSRTFSENATVFGKVYFPRLILPLSKVVSGIVKLLIQFGLFACFWLYFVFVTHAVTPNWTMVFFPLLLVVFALMGLGFGILITSLTTKYRDLTFLVTFGVQLLMYATPIIYPITEVPADKQFWIWLNPLTSLFEAFKYAFLGHGVVSPLWLSYSVCFTIVLFLVGIVVFNKVEKKFIDTV